MPIYEYGCPKCEREFEVLHGISDNSARKCPECGAKMKKLISLGSFHLKGGGWYKDGYGSSGSSGESAKSTSTSSAATGGSETTTASGDSKKEKGKSKGTKAA